MSTQTLPLATLAAQVTAAGISAPVFADIVNSDVATYQGIYGDDAVLTPDTQDFQLIATRALAIRDSNDLAIAVYNSFSPLFAQGVGLSVAVQINGIQREVPTNSTVVLVLVGQAGITIPAGIVQDQNNNLWSLPPNIQIPPAGTIQVTATAQQAGAISAGPGQVNIIFTITPGWQSVTNPAAATPGSPVETDAALRARQAQSVALSAETPLSTILSAAANSGGIARFAIYENQTRQTDVNGVPGNSVAVVVEGGNVTAVATAIESKKSPGTGTFGTTSIPILDPAGIPVTINFFEMTEVPIFAAITIQPLTGFVAANGTAAVNAAVAFISGLDIGEEVFYNWVLGAAGLVGTPAGLTFVIVAMTLGTSPSSLSVANIPIAFNAGAQCSAANITLTITAPVTP
jgi:uncharacterized phage protein gp47/JayE